MKRRICCDFHAHILPNADHGSDSVEVSIIQLACAADCGIDNIVATPHFYPHCHTIEDFCALREDSYNKLMMQNVKGAPKIIKGAEVQLCDGLDRISGIENLCIENTNILLLELPNREFTDMMQKTVLRLQEQRDITVVIAHPERYSIRITDVLERMCLPFQINAQGVLSVRTRKRCLKWINDDRVWAFGSDAHKDGKAFSQFAKMKNKLGDNFYDIQEKTRLLFDLERKFLN